MRTAILILALFCALISGWTASLAQVQDLGGMMAMHHTGASAHHATPATAGPEHCAASDCDHHPRMVHPMLCAACFAIALDGINLDRDDLGDPILHPLPQKPMQAVALEPQFPPPKTSLSAC